MNLVPSIELNDRISPEYLKQQRACRNSPLPQP